MKTLSAVLLTALVATTWTALPVADAKQEIKGSGTGLAERIQDLHLSDAQEAKIEEIRKLYGPKVQTASKELTSIIQEEVNKIRELLTPDQKAELAKIKEERKDRREESLAERFSHLEELELTDAEMAKIAEIRKEYRPKITKAMGSMKGILNDDQRKVREEALKAGKSRKEIMASLKLSDDQKEKMETVCKEVGGLFRDEMHKIRDLLTESQKEKLSELKDERQERARGRMAHMIANLKELKLNDAQSSKITAIRNEYRPRVHEASNRLRATVREEVDMIVTVIKS